MKLIMSWMEFPAFDLGEYCDFPVAKTDKTLNRLCCYFSLPVYGFNFSRLNLWTAF